MSDRLLPEWKHEVVVRHPDGSETNLGISAGLREPGAMDEAVRQSVLLWIKQRKDRDEFNVLIHTIRDARPSGDR